MSTLAIKGGEPLRTKSFTSWPKSGEEELERLKRVLNSGQWGTLGAETEKFAKRYAAYCNAKYAVATPNGTVSLEVILRALNIGRGDEVILPPYTFVATASAITFAGATPVFADIDENTYNLDPANIEQHISQRTKAIIAVHLGGRPCDMDKIMDVARKHKLYVIEDAAHAHGSEWKGRKVGSIGDVGSFSFQASKNLCCGEGGAITTNNENLYKSIWSVHNCGRDYDSNIWYQHPVLGTNARMAEWQAVILDVQLNKLDGEIEKRMTNAAYLTKRLKETGFIDALYEDPNITKNSHHLYVFKYKKERCWGIHRDLFVKALHAEGIGLCATGYSLPIYRMVFLDSDAFRKATGCTVSYKDISLPVNDRAAYEEGAWLYHTALLGGKEDIDDIVDAMLKIYEHADELSNE
ncbi:MAG TPA: DegT/DnrJ/EryC1/StrS family aminotransferase [Clostridiales bacterium]|nr:DegT/DnrJ/EryC1/StrS family aminotransferase [Clostridiales bacterium]